MSQDSLLLTAQERLPLPGFGAIRWSASDGSTQLGAVRSLHQSLVGEEALSWILLVLAAIAWLALAVDFARQLLRDRARWKAEAETPLALTAVAATTILGTWFALQGWSGVAVAALVVAVLIWPVLLTSVVRHWRRHLPGAVFLVCVATQGLAVLSGTLVVSLPSGWLAWPTLGCFVLGLVLYAFACLRFDLGQVRSGAGDQWVAGGTLAISALAGAPAWPASPSEWAAVTTATCQASAPPSRPASSSWAMPTSWDGSRPCPSPTF
ncbi:MULTISPECIES: hypothetical protein [unclassified Streptomyces]|uniref:hypothetical protein n=1 Tax=unclassified Streptomyces TaxID=2593676 RepID=UPI002DD80DA7|nr:hypothetical protein [Streptomyces sp. NBC_01445]WSE02978.1 hypothetical protein OG574_06025 [Streptomyces sp. NBC_01445]